MYQIVNTVGQITNIRRDLTFIINTSRDIHFLIDQYAGSHMGHLSTADRIWRASKANWLEYELTSCTPSPQSAILLGRQLLAHHRTHVLHGTSNGA